MLHLSVSMAVKKLSAKIKGILYKNFLVKKFFSSDTFDEYNQWRSTCE